MAHENRPIKHGSALEVAWFLVYQATLTMEQSRQCGSRAADTWSVVLIPDICYNSEWGWWDWVPRVQHRTPDILQQVFSAQMSSRTCMKNKQDMNEYLLSQASWEGIHGLPSHLISLLQMHNLVYLCLCGFAASCGGMERILSST